MKKRFLILGIFGICFSLFVQAGNEIRVRVKDIQDIEKSESGRMTFEYARRQTRLKKVFSSKSLEEIGTMYESNLEKIKEGKTLTIKEQKFNRAVHLFVSFYKKLGKKTWEKLSTNKLDKNPNLREFSLAVISSMSNKQHAKSNNVLKYLNRSRLVTYIKEKESNHSFSSNGQKIKFVRDFMEARRLEVAAQRYNKGVGVFGSSLEKCLVNWHTLNLMRLFKIMKSKEVKNVIWNRGSTRQLIKAWKKAYMRVLDAKEERAKEAECKLASKQCRVLSPLFLRACI